MKMIKFMILDIIISLYSTLSFGFIATLFSKWFILPIFPQFPQLNTYQYGGILWFIYLFFHTIGLAFMKDEYKISKGEQYIFNIIFPWVVLLFGWLFKIIFI